MAFHRRSISLGVDVKNPSVSRLRANGSTPSIEDKPYVGLSPVMPQYDAGRRTDPLVCVPIANGTIPAATAAAEPLELPPGVCSGFLGFRVGAGVVHAKGVVWVLPITIAPRPRSCRTIAASAEPRRPL